MFVFLLCQSPLFHAPNHATCLIFWIWSLSREEKLTTLTNRNFPQGLGLSSLQIHLVCWSSSWSPPRSAEVSRFKPRVGWEATRVDVCEAPNPRYFVCLFKSQVWSLGRILVDLVPMIFPHPFFFWGGGGTQSFIYFGPAWNRRKTEVSPSTTWVFTSWSKLGSTFSTKRHFPSNDSKQLRTS